jgi:hypothetical protein
MPATDPVDVELIDWLQRSAFRYFCESVNTSNGLTADTSRDGSPCSIAVVGFALSCYPVAVTRGWMSRADSADRVLTTLRFFAASHQGPETDATGHMGFYYHFLDMDSGRRVWSCELSMIDTSLLIAGVLTSAAFFSDDATVECEIRDLAEMLYQRVDWDWARDDRHTLSQGWTPEIGFFRYDWEGYSEATLLYVLALGSPSHALTKQHYKAWTVTYQWERMYGVDVLYAGPLFIHLFSHAWIDFRGIRDQFMAARGSDYFKNTQRIISVQREYARRNPLGFDGYAQDVWGLTACDGPQERPVIANGEYRRTLGYSARGVPFGPDDGTLAPWAALACLPFDPTLSLLGLKQLLIAYPGIVRRDGRFPGSFNPSLNGTAAEVWISEGCFGLDQGLLVMSIENFRSGLIWRLMRQSDPVRTGLIRAGFRNGWLA